MTTTYAIERWQECWEEITPLWEAHGRELGRAMAPDQARYRALDAAGLLLLATMRDEGRLVGIHRSVLGPDLHQISTWYAVSDGWFVLPSARKGMAALPLLDTAVAEAQARGLTALYQPSPVGHEIGALLRRQGWTHTDTLYKKECKPCPRL